MKYRTLVADPPWPMVDARTRPLAPKGKLRGRDKFTPYPLQSVEWICSLPVVSLADADAHLFLWVPNGLNREGVGVAVARAWGFMPVTEIVWEKPIIGLGKFPRPCHEHLLIARRGTLPFVGPRNIRSVQRWRQATLSGGGRIHSAKPEGALDLIEQVSPGPYVELFARRQRLGWDTWGAEAANTAAFYPEVAS